MKCCRCFLFFEDAFYGILKTEGEALEEGKRYMLKYLGYLEGELSARRGKPYFGGEQFGYLDIAFIPYACWFHSFETFGKWKIPWESEFPRLQQWMKKCMQRESAKKILPDPLKVLEYATPFRKNFVTSE
jgi:glutathione S-transferase